jgi:transposase-like protein
MTQAEVRQAWEARIAAYRASGQSAAELCAIHQLHPRQLWYWLRKFKNTKAMVTPSSQ